MRASTMSTPSDTGRAPPDRPVPDPRATNGTPASEHARTVPRAWSAVSGSTTTLGMTRKLARPSHS
jgi:hypothetical protein